LYFVLRRLFDECCFPPIPNRSMVDIVVPSVGESISEVQISKWLKKEGDWVAAGTDLVELETEKASVQVSAPEDGILVKILKKDEEFASVGDVIASFQAAAKGAAGQPATGQPAGVPPTATPIANTVSTPANTASQPAAHVMPSAQRMLDDNNVPAANVPASAGVAVSAATTAAAKSVAATISPPAQPTTSHATTAIVEQGSANRAEEVKPMSMIRRTIATRLVQAQHTAALLTTFNEVDMQPVMSLRKKYQEAFLEKHGVKLGFMSFFAKASCEALKRYPSVNAEIRGSNVVYRKYFDIGIAIGGGKGLVVPVLRNVEKMGFAEIERTIGEYASRAMANKLMPEDLEGGTFTISNGGIYGSLLSTPIVNPPQSGILGLHSIQERPIALNGEVVIRPMMYLALTYDHRIIDGREAVSFLKTIKEVIEDPSRLFLEI
jgi:2-oxoglutarate dehydrogenase E2 component (dihydrolipoamide succinyltransferase)